MPLRQTAMWCRSAEALRQLILPIESIPEVGNHCAGAKVSGRIVPLNTELQNSNLSNYRAEEQSP